MEENKKKNLMRQIIRFAFVGGSAFVIDYGVMIFLTELIGINYLPAEFHFRFRLFTIIF